MSEKYELLNYMPDYYDGVYEMEELLKAESLTVGEFEDKATRTLLNEFIIQTDEQGISIFEDQLVIIPDPDEGLKARQKNVLMRLLPPQPLTLRYLNNLLKIMDLKAVVTVDYANRFAYADTKSADIDEAGINRIKYILNISLPANMNYQIRVALRKATVTNHVYYALVPIYDPSVTVQSNSGQINFRNDLITDIFVGAGTDWLSDYTISANKQQVSF